MNFYNPFVSMVDFPDILSVVVFTKGCNCRCPVCHNPKLVLPELDDDPPAWRASRVADFAEAQWADGICITGGEPTLHADLPAAIDTMHGRASIQIKLDTNGSNPHMLKQLLDSEVLSYVALDVKAPLRGERLAKVCGVEWQKGRRYLSLLRESIELLKDGDTNYQFRTVCCEHFLSPEDVGDIARELAPALRYDLLRFKPTVTLDPKLQEFDDATDAYMEACLKAAQEHIPNTRMER